jgi:hypothetical protein
MPLTPSHVAVAPLLRGLLRPLRLTVPLSALVIGTMTPDFEYLIRLTPGGGAWHSLPGLVEFCLPGGLLSWLIFRAIVGPALLRLLPPGLGRAAQAQVAPGPTLRLLPGAALAVLLGAVSHDVWDSFTHEYRWGVRRIPALAAPVISSGSDPIPWYSLLWWGSSAIGLIVVIGLVWRWIAAQPAAARHVPAGDRAWRIRELGVLLLAGAIGAPLNATQHWSPDLAFTLGLAAVGGMSALVVALLAYGIIDALRQRAESRFRSRH